MDRFGADALRLGRFATRYAWARSVVERLKSSPSRELRMRCAPALHALARTDRTAIDDLVHLYADEECEVRHAAGYWLARCVEHHPSLLRTLKDALGGDAEARAGIAAGLGDAPPLGEAAFDLLLALACDTDGRTRAAACAAIGRAGERHPLRAVRALRDLLFFGNGPDEYICQGAAQGLACLLRHSTPGVGRLAAELAADPAEARRWCAALALAGAVNLGAAAERVLLALARDASPMVRGELAVTAGALGAAGVTLARRLLEGLVTDSDGFVRSLAVESIGRAEMGDPGWAAEALGRCAAAHDHAVRMGAAAGLGHLAATDPAAASAPLVSLAQDKWAVVRARAAGGLSACWGACAQARRTLRKLTHDSHPMVRTAAALGLAAAAQGTQPRPLHPGVEGRSAPAPLDPHLWRTLESLARDPYADVRRAAVTAIGDIGHRAPRRAVETLGHHLSDAPRAGLADAVACTLAAFDAPERLWQGARIALACTSESLLRELARAARDFTTAELMAIAADLAHDGPTPDLLKRTAALAESEGAAPLAGAVSALAGLLQARDFEGFARAARQLPDRRALESLLSFLPDLDAKATVEYVFRPSLQEAGKDTHPSLTPDLEAAIHMTRQLRDLAGRSPAIIFRQVATRVLATHAALMADTAPGRVENPALAVELLPGWASANRETAIALRLHNEGGAPARNISVCAEAAAPYEVTLLDGEPLARLAPHEETLVALRLSAPHALDDASALMVAGELAYDDQTGRRHRAGFTCRAQIQPVPARRRRAATPNPYVPGKPLEPDSPMFVGRGDTFDFVRGAMRGAYQENVVALVGPRRIGKTSILRQIERRLSDIYWPAFVDMQGIMVREVGDLCRILAECCRDAVGVALTTPPPQELVADLGALPRFLEHLTRAADSDKRLLIMFDEFDDLEHKVRSGLLPERVFAYLRHLIQHSPQVAFALSGTHRLEELGRQYWSFLFNLAIYRKVGRLDADESHRAVMGPMADAGIACDDLAAHHVVELSGGHPYFLQLLGHHLVSRCQRLGRPHLGYDAVRESVGAVIEWGETHLRYLWELGGPVEQAVMAAVHRAGRDGITLCDLTAVLREHDCELAPAAIARAVDELIEKDLVVQIDQPEPRYKPTMGVLGEWIRQRYPLARVARLAAAHGAA